MTWHICLHLYTFIWPLNPPQFNVGRTLVRRVYGVIKTTEANKKGNVRNWPDGEHGRFAKWQIRQLVQPLLTPIDTQNAHAAFIRVTFVPTWPHWVDFCAFTRHVTLFWNPWFGTMPNLWAHWPLWSLPPTVLSKRRFNPHTSKLKEFRRFF